MSLRDLEGLVALAPTDVTGTARLRAPEGRYTMEVQRNGDTLSAPIDVTAGALDTWTVDGTIEPREESLPTSEPLLGVNAQSGFRGSYRVENSLVTVELGTPEGIIYLSAPEFVELETQVSWGITLWPSGDTPKKLEKNRNELAGYGLEIGGVAVDLEKQEWVRIEASTRTSISLTRKRSNVLAGYVPSQIGTPNGWTPAADTVRAGQGQSFFGTFDGDISNTRVQIDGKDVRVVAESTVSISIYTDSGYLGMTAVTVFEGSLEQYLQFRNIGLEMSIDQAHLKRGQRTTAHIKVTGLGGVTEPTHLAVVNATPGIITLAPRNAQVITIAPSQVSAAGTYQFDPGVTGVTPGDFVIGAMVLSR